MATNPFSTPTGQPFTNKPASQGGASYTDYQKRVAADPNYKASKSSDMVGWIVQNYGKEWLKADGTAPDEAIWTYTGGQNGSPKIGSVTGINYLPWNDKNNQYDQANGQDYSRPQYANGPAYPSSGYKGTAAEIQADRDKSNFYRNGGQGMNPAMLQAMQGASYIGVPRDSYNLPGGGTYTKSKGVSKENPWGKNATYNGPGGSWNENYWGKKIENGVFKGLYPGQKTMEALELNGFSRSGNQSNGLRPGQFIGTPPRQGGGQQQQSGQPPAQPNIPGAVPAGPSPYMQLPQGGNQFMPTGPAAARGPWMQQQSNAEALAMQMAQAAALKG